jgi:hypothetical protein
MNKVLVLYGTGLLSACEMYSCNQEDHYGYRMENKYNT